MCRFLLADSYPTQADHRQIFAGAAQRAAWKGAGLFLFAAPEHIAYQCIEAESCTGHCSGKKELAAFHCISSTGLLDKVEFR